MNLPTDPNGLVRDITDRAQTERLLRSQSLVMQVMRDAVTIFDHHGVVLDMNPAAEVMLGWSREELVGRNVADLYKMAKVSGLDRNEIAESIQERGYWQGEYSFVRRDGVEVMAEATSYPIPDEATGKLGRVTIIRDITERKQADDALRESEERLQGAHRIAKLGHWKFDIATQCFTAYGEMFANLDYGGAESEFSFEEALRPIHPEDVERVRDAFQRSFTDGVPYDETDRVMYDDGQIGHMRLIGEVVRDDAGAIVGMRGTTQDVTELATSNQALRESEEQNRSIVVALSEGVIFQDAKGQIIDLNTRAEEILGYGSDIIKGATSHNPVWQAVREDQTPFPSDEHPAVVTLATGKPCRDVVMGIQHPGKGLRWLEINSEPLIENEASKPYAVVVSFADITERKEAEEALHRSEERYALAAMYGRTAAWEIFPEEGKIYTDNNLMALLGMPDTPPPTELDALMDTLHEEDREYVAQAMGDVFEGRARHFSVEHRSRRVDGSYGWHRDEGYVASNTGEPLRVVGTTSDITAHKQAEQELRKVQDSLATAQRIAGIGSWELNPTRLVSTWSDEMYRIFDLDPETDNSPGRDTFYEFVHPKDKDKLAAAIQQAIDDRQPMTLEYRLITKQGNEKTVLTFGEVEFDDAGELISFSGTLQDITALRQAEQRLQQSQKMEAVGQLTGGIAHDFNNLLAVISGNLELVQEQLPGNSDLRKMLQAAFGASQRGADLTGRLLSFSRRQTLMPQPTDINELTGHMLDLARRTLGESVEVIFEPAKEACWASVDPAQLENALLNLAINARDAMPDGGTLTIRTENVSTRGKTLSTSEALSAGEYVLVEVTDTGAGMSEDVREKVFEPFFTTKEVGEGSGLGLSMVYGFVKQSGGHVDIESKLGEGTAIRLYLPRSEQTGQEASEVQAATFEVRSSGETVLIVEDDPHVRELAVSLVISLGYIVLEAGDASSALEIMENGTQIDLLLSDVILGKGMNGVELANQVREICPDTKVLLMSGYAREAFTKEDGLEDAYELISKPFKMADLAQKIEVLLQ